MKTIDLSAINQLYDCPILIAIQKKPYVVHYTKNQQYSQYPHPLMPKSHIH